MAVPKNCFPFFLINFPIEASGDSVNNVVGFGFIGWGENKMVLAGDFKEVVEFLKMIA